MRSGQPPGIFWKMASPEKPIALSPEQIAELNKNLSAMRHNINNHLALIVAASELIRRKPELAGKFIENISQQPDRIVAEIRSFSEQFEKLFGIERAEAAPAAAPAD